MKKVVLLNFFPLFLAAGVMAAGEEVDYSKISEAKSARLNDVVARYIRIYGEPCAIFQVLNPRSGWEVISTKRVCSFGGKSFETDFADAHFEAVSFSSRGAHLTLSLTPLEATGEQEVKCFVPIEGGEIDTMVCESIITH